ncbi:hypothetical protein DTO166G4_1626 [Paecilomyces variotii]|uniref:PRISE-like Rossmann-fold domain-containing protein n=1 Tax=Byssochlamys spectabilis TaxID=264951 RepID=A0A443HR00_BYSSP|nr:hypothetical protein C8Q69DRAFT_473249 [Paecilomyces variotii]KAJ9198133.1 hypothetical protein DTO164E3_5389 [Paecilomyces variotii]KAJ9216780.1 hypothetical protein DTO166G4_1626 [Paecilomyces variotii]KAJ9222378.1 hypothetical protein DTO169C6_5313 [Paecilomyces variotii]KAJ9236926.1 hypothetical protein DTO169E5_5407 [Paecilomyces variotii]KAJ9237950.1 hypothetical protein DTO166G5_3187 [Paecilomyces variotii]
MAASQQQVIVSKNIYHGLPAFSDDVAGLTAIVTGANGISGDHMLRVLCESPKRWKKIYALSRRPPNGEWPSYVEHVSMDFLKSPETLAAQMKEKGIKSDYVFFFSYIQPAAKEGGDLWSAAEELVKINTTLLQNFLDALVLSDTVPKSFLLQLGAKYYGTHLGPTAVPQEESDPRVHLEPNFYYPQEDLLKEFCQKHNCNWVTTRPSWVPGAVPDAAMNVVLPLAIYATVQKYLGQPLEFPADLTAWETAQTMSSAQMNCYLAEWAVLTPGAQNESFNATDDCAFTWGKFWPKLAAKYQMPWKGPDLDDSAFRESESKFNPPPRGFGPPGKQRVKFTLTEWAKRPEVQKAWKEIAAKHDLRQKELWDTDRVFGFTDIAMTWSIALYFSTTKAKKLGFFGFVDSNESIFKVIDEFADLKMVPKSP